MDGRRIIDPIKHDRILADLDGISRRTGIHSSFITDSMRRWCDDEEIQWVLNLRLALADGEITGLAYIGKITRVMDRMQAIGGACIRNFIEARVVPIEDLVDYDHSNVSVLLVPDFYTGDIPTWKRTKLLSMLLGRHAARQATVIYVSNGQAMKRDYGEPLTNHVNETFFSISGPGI